MRKSYNVKKSEIISPKYWDALAVLEGTIEEIEIPYGCTTFDGNLLNGLKSLKRVILPETIRSLDGLCLAYCSNLEKVEYRGTVNQWGKISQGYGCFISTPLLTEITCLDGVVPVEDNA